MKILIDARSPGAELRLFSLSATERVLRQLDHAGCITATVVMTSGEQPMSFLSNDLTKNFKIKVDRFDSSKTLAEVANSFLLNEDRVILIEGDGVYDDRIIARLIHSQTSLQIINGKPGCPLAAVWIRGILEHTTSPPAPEILQTTEMPSYIKFLRKSVEPLLLRLSSDTPLREIENLLFDNTFKSGLEWVAIYGYRIPVRELTRFFARTPITPNHLTLLAMLFRWGSIPLLFAGWIGTGLSMIIGFVILDSLDGKLARMTLRFTDWADWLDHGSVLPTRLGWYAGLGWHFSGGNLSDPIAWLTSATLLVVVLDDVNWTIAKRRFHRTLFDLTDFDARVHLYTHRRNDMFVMLIGYWVNFGLATFVLLCAWVLLTWVWHCSRLFKHWDSLGPSVNE